MEIICYNEETCIVDGMKCVFHVTISETRKVVPNMCETGREGYSWDVERKIPLDKIVGLVLRSKNTAGEWKITVVKTQISTE